MLPAGGGTLLFTGATASVKARPPFTAFAAALRALAHGLARELGPQGLHVGHVLVDGVIAGDQVLSRMPKLADELGEDGMLSPDAIADVYWHLHTQHRSAWTLELDLRPYRGPCGFDARVHDRQMESCDSRRFLPLSATRRPL